MMIVSKAISSAFLCPPRAQTFTAVGDLSIPAMSKPFRCRQGFTIPFEAEIDFAWQGLHPCRALAAVVVGFYAIHT